MSDSSHPLTVLVTGAAGGLGRVIATAFLENGNNVAICDVNKDRLSETSALWENKYPNRFMLQQADVSSIPEMEAYVQAIVDKFGHLDILINNAAILDKFEPAGTCSLDMWNRILNVNITGPFICSKVAVNQMLAQSPPGGSIINLGSNASICGTDGGLAYTVSKHGVLGLTRSTAAYYLDQGITCTMVQLGGLAQTNIQDSMAHGFDEKGVGLIDKHMGGFDYDVNAVPLEDVAKFCVFLSSNREIALTMNGASVPFNRNWPAGH